MFIFYNKKKGGRFASSPNFPVLSGWLSSDIAGGQLQIKKIQRKISALKKGKLTHWERVGNAYVLELSKDKAVIYPNYDTDDFIEEVIDIDKFQTVIEGWLSFLISPDATRELAI